MKHQNYSKTISARITAKEAEDKINHVSAWWVKNVKDPAQKPGDTFTVRFSKISFVDFKIVEVISEKRIVWQVTNCNLPWLQNKTEWNNTQVVWEISTDNKTTTVHMTHVGLAPGIECYEACEKGWDFYIGESLLNLLTENKGLPDGQHKKRSA